MFLMFDFECGLAAESFFRFLLLAPLLAESFSSSRSSSNISLPSSTYPLPSARHQIIINISTIPITELFTIVDNPIILLSALDPLRVLLLIDFFVNIVHLRHFALVLGTFQLLQLLQCSKPTGAVLLMSFGPPFYLYNHQNNQHINTEN